MFLEQGIKEDNHFLKYILGSFLVILASFIGQVPFMVAGFVKSFKDGKGIPINQDDFMKIFDPNTTLFLLLLSFVFAVFGLYFTVKYFHKQSFLSIVTTRKKLDWNRIIFAFLVWGIFTAVSTYASYYLAPQDFVWNFNLVPFLILSVIAIVLVPIQTSCEEFVFRGYLMQGFANLSKNRWFPLVMTSVIFGSMHILNPEVGKMGYIVLVYYIGTGFLLGIFTLMDEGMELSLGFHAANNLVGALLVTSDWSVFQTDSILKDISDPTAGLEIFIPVFVIYPILIFIFSKKYGWSNWKEKLTGNIVDQKHLQEIEKIGNNE